MNRILTAAVVVLAACDRPDSPQPVADEAPLADARATCVQLFERQRACTDDFIPALVDLRRELDAPKGIATLPRADTVRAALDEWKTDSTDEAIATQCDRLAPKLAGAAVAQARGCVVVGACGKFVGCVMPLMRAQLSVP